MAGVFRQIAAAMGAIFALLLLSIGPMRAQDNGLAALARLDVQQSSVTQTDGIIALDLHLSQPVPYAVRLMDAPPRLIVDTRAVDWAGIETLIGKGGQIRDLRAGAIRPGWTRLVAELAGPFAVSSVELQTGAADGSALLALRLAPAMQADFASLITSQQLADWVLPQPAETGNPPKIRQTGDQPLVIVLDPGHGGIDPGAEAGGLKEADLMLVFARELKDALLRAGNAHVILTREDDVFVPLETRISVARAVGADLLIALHADALDEGTATGATIYTMSETASDKASAQLAERHDRADLLAGVDLQGADDVVASVLMDMARTETAPRADRLADALVTAIKAADLRMHKHPRQGASFSVLKSPDIPSVLVEIGFLSSLRDRERLQDPDWRAKMAGAIVAGIEDWAVDDAAEAQLLRQ